MIVAMREVTKRAGTWADPVENMVRQVTDPIAKKIGLPTLPTDIESVRTFLLAIKVNRKTRRRLREVDCLVS